MPKLILFSIFGFSLFACSTSSRRLPAQESVRFDFGLLQPYSPEIGRRTLEAPFVAQYHHSSKELIYIATRHLSVRESPQVREHPTFKTVLKIFAEQKPDVLIIGGVPSGDEVSPAWYAEFARSCNKRDYANCGESALAAYLADQNKIPFMNGDPSDLELKSELVNQGYASQTILGFFVARQIPQHFRSDPTFGRVDKVLRNSINHDLKRYQQELADGSIRDYESFNEWLKSFCGKSIQQLSSEQSIAPLKTGTPIQKISFQVELIRNQALLRTIERMMNLHDRVLVVYGSAHYLSQRSALDAALGSSRLGKYY